jgi:glycerol uptake facilitator-like aquaporin
MPNGNNTMNVNTKLSAAPVTAPSAEVGSNTNAPVVEAVNNANNVNNVGNNSNKRMERMLLIGTAFFGVFFLLFAILAMSTKDVEQSKKYTRYMYCFLILAIILAIALYMRR